MKITADLSRIRHSGKKYYMTILVPVRMKPSYSLASQYDVEYQPRVVDITKYLSAWQKIMVRFYHVLHWLRNKMSVRQ